MAHYNEQETSLQTYVAAHAAHTLVIDGLAADLLNVCRGSPSQERVLLEIRYPSGSSVWRRALDGELIHVADAGALTGAVPAGGTLARAGVQARLAGFACLAPARH
jgi:hypothetical protein